METALTDTGVAVAETGIMQSTIITTLSGILPADTMSTNSGYWLGTDREPPCR